MHRYTRITYIAWLWIALYLPGALPGQYIDPFFPSKLYAPGGYEIHIFQNYYTASRILDDRRQFRYSFYTVYCQFLYGWKESWNIGLDLKLRSVARESSPKISPFHALYWRNSGYFRTTDAEGYFRSGLSAVGIQWKWRPWSFIDNLILHQTLYFPTALDLEGNEETGFLDWSGLSLYTRLYYDEAIAESVYLFVEFAAVVENIGPAAIGVANGAYQLSTPINLIMSWYPWERHGLYVLVNAAPQWYVTVIRDGRVRDAVYNTYNQYGLGYKWTIGKRWLVEWLWTRFYSTSHGLYQATYNMGLRYFVNPL